MKIKNIITGTALAATFGGMVLSGCTESELYSAGAPDWIADSVSAVAARNAANAGESTFAQETVTADGWWTAWSKAYSFPESQRMTIEITLDKSTREKRWKNFAMVVATTGWEFPSSGQPNGEDGYAEYFVVRGDAGNWNGPKGTVNVTADESLDLANEDFVSFQEDGSKFTIVAEHYPTGSILINSTQVTPSGAEYHWTANGTAEAGSGCQVFFAGEGSTFTITNITYETLEELKPTKLEVTGTPTAVEVTEEEVEPSYYYGDGVATVTWSNGTTSTVGIDELTFSVIPDLKTVGTANVLVAYGKTSMGQYCQPVVSSYKLEVTNPITAISAKYIGVSKTFYYFDNDITLQSNLFEVESTYSDDTKGTLDSKNINFTLQSDGKVIAKYNDDITCEVSNITTAKGSAAAGNADRTSSWVATKFAAASEGSPVIVKAMVYGLGVNDWECALPEISGTSANGGWTLCLNGNNWGFQSASMTASIVKNDFSPDFENGLSHLERKAEVTNGLDFVITFTHNGNGTATITETATTSDGKERTIELLVSNVPDSFDTDVTIDGAYVIFHD